MNLFAKFDEIPSMILQDIKETKRYGQTDGRSFGRTDNVKTVYPPTNKVCGGIMRINMLIGTSKVYLLMIMILGMVAIFFWGMVAILTYILFVTKD